MEPKVRNRELAKQILQYRAGSSATDSAIHHFLHALDCPRALTVWLLYSSGEHDQLVELAVSPLDHNDPEAFRDSYLATNFLSKANFLKLTVDKKTRALKKFFEFEELCKETNRRFLSPALDPLANESSAWLLNATKRKIQMILGDYSAEEFVESANWGPGVTTLLKGEHVSATNKFHSENGITRDLHSLVSGWFSAAYPLWAKHLEDSHVCDLDSGCFTFQRGNKIVTVPKNSKTDRVIAIEPGVNLWFQKAIGTMIRRRLSRQGVNLNSQDKNQQFAHEAAFYGLHYPDNDHFDCHLATVDFSSASDSISRELVRELLPPRWYTLLDSCRSKIGVAEDQVITWQKFSSMGNGFTFELESLIFYAAALAVCEYQERVSSDVNVFGDDVILPSSCYLLYSRFCSFLGFRVNPQKSFSSGGFRESCGAHYFGALDCKPLYLKERLNNVQSIYKLANSVRLLARRCGSYHGCDARFRFTWSRLFRRVPKHFRFVIPQGLGDSGFIGNFDEACPAVPGRGYEGYLVRGLIETGVSQSFEGFGLLLDRIRGGQEQAHGNSYVLRGRTRIGVSTILVSSWCNLGPWV